MSAPKHILLRIWHKGANDMASKPTKTTVVWELDRWYTHRDYLVIKRGYTMDEANAKYVITVGGRKRLKVLQASLSRLDNA